MYDNLYVNYRNCKSRADSLPIYLYLAFGGGWIRLLIDKEIIFGIFWMTYKIKEIMHMYVYIYDPVASNILLCNVGLS